MMNQVMTPIQQQFGKPCLCRATLSVWEKVCLWIWIWRILLGAVWLSRTVACALVALSLNGHHMFDHKRVLVLKSFWPVFVIELSDTDTRVCHKGCALLLEWFLVALSHGKFSFQMNVQFTAAPNLEMLFGAHCLRSKTTHHTWWSAGVTASYIIGWYFFDGTVSGVTCIKCGIMLYQIQATVGLCNRCHFSKIVLQCISPCLCVNSSMDH